MKIRDSFYKQFPKSKFKLVKLHTLAAIEKAALSKQILTTETMLTQNNYAFAEQLKSIRNNGTVDVISYTKPYFPETQNYGLNALDWCNFYLNRLFNRVNVYKVAPKTPSVLNYVKA